MPLKHSSSPAKTVRFMSPLTEQLEIAAANKRSNKVMLATSFSRSLNECGIGCATKDNLLSKDHQHAARSTRPSHGVGRVRLKFSSRPPVPDTMDPAHRNNVRLVFVDGSPEDVEVEVNAVNNEMLAEQLEEYRERSDRVDEILRFDYHRVRITGRETPNQLRMGSHSYIDVHPLISPDMLSYDLDDEDAQQAADLDAELEAEFEAQFGDEDSMLKEGANEAEETLSSDEGDTQEKTLTSDEEGIVITDTTRICAILEAELDNRAVHMVANKDADGRVTFLITAQSFSVPISPLSSARTGKATAAQDSTSSTDESEIESTEASTIGANEAEVDSDEVDPSEDETNDTELTDTEITVTETVEAVIAADVPEEVATSSTPATTIKTSARAHGHGRGRRHGRAVAQKSPKGIEKRPPSKRGRGGVRGSKGRGHD